ncbi:uncharacterized protein at1g03900, partial [Phtheirospermum japonicum]
GDLRAHTPSSPRSLRLQNPSAADERGLQVRRVAPVRQDLVGSGPGGFVRYQMRDPTRGPKLRRVIRRLLHEPGAEGGCRRVGVGFVEILRAEDRGRAWEARVRRIGVLTSGMRRLISTWRCRITRSM